MLCYSRWVRHVCFGINGPITAQLSNGPWQRSGIAWSHLLLSFTFPYINWPITEGEKLAAHVLSEWGLQKLSWSSGIWQTTDKIWWCSDADVRRLSRHFLHCSMPYGSHSLDNMTTLRYQVWSNKMYNINLSWDLCHQHQKHSKNVSIEHISKELSGKLPLMLLRWFSTLWCCSAGSQSFDAAPLVLNPLMLLRWFSILWCCSAGSQPFDAAPLVLNPLMLLHWFSTLWCWSAGSHSL